MLKTTRLDLRMLAFGYDALMSSGVRQLARVTMSSQASYCDQRRAAKASAALQPALMDLDAIGFVLYFATN
jgi:hypothetical protein